MARHDLNRFVLVGISSQCERAKLETLDAMGRTSDAARSEGFIPSEAACVVVVERADDRGPRVHVALTAVDTKAHAQGDALAACIHKVLARSETDPREIAEVWSDMNGERWRAEEWARATAQTLSLVGATPPVVHPALNMGDTGAAAAMALLVLAGLACEELNRPILVLSSARSELRGAAVLRPRPEQTS